MATPQNVNKNHAATCSIPFNTFSTTSNIAPSVVTTVIPQRFGHTAPIPLCSGGPPHHTQTAPAAKNAILFKALVDAITNKMNDPLPEWRLSEYNEDPPQWHKSYGQIKIAIEIQSLTDDVKLKYLKILVTGKAKTAIVKLAYCGAMCKDVLRTLESKFGQPQLVLSAQLDKLSSSLSLRCTIARTSLTIRVLFEPCRGL